ncbi:ferredoxin [Oxalobacteraceae bacterium GrIS 1.11]
MNPLFSVKIAPQGWQFQAGPDTSLLLAAEQAGIRLPSSCRNGTCRSCICRMLDGRVRYRIEWPGLSKEEKQDGYILPCVAIAESDLSLEAGRAQLVLRD